jgi:hypothetical protein
MSSVTSPSVAAVTDDHVVVGATVVDPVVVSFDGQYVWSFSPRRDGSRSRQGWRVTWPHALHELLDGTTCVRLSDSEGGLVHFEGLIAFRGNDEPLALRDTHGHPLAVDKAGHLTRVFSQTDGDVRRHIAEGTARAISDLRDHVGIDAHVSYGCLLGAVRTGHMIGHDSDADLAYLSHWTHPADIVRESFRMERELRALGWKVIRMSGADLKLLLPLEDGRMVHIDIFGAFHVEGTFYQLGGRSGILDRAALTPASTVTLEGVELAAPADPETVLEFLYGPDWRIPDPAFSPVDPWAGTRRLEGWMRGVRTNVVAWNELYRYRGGSIPRKRSPFALWAKSRMDRPATLVDLGSGTGRDTATASSASTTREQHCARRDAGSPGARSSTPTSERSRSTTSAPPCWPGPSWRASPNRRTCMPATWSVVSTSRPAPTCGGCRRCRCGAVARSSWSTPRRDLAFDAQHPVAWSGA